MKKSTMLFLLSLSALSYSELSGELKTGLDFKVNFKNGAKEIYNENTEQNEKKHFFKYSHSEYDINVLSLNLKDDIYGFNFGTNLKSSRKNILLNDYQNERINKKDKDYNHDIQGKLYLNWSYLYDKNINNKLGVEYYVENFAKTRLRDNKNNIVEAEDKKSEQYEYVVSKDEKYIGGDVKLFSDLEYKINENMKYTNNLEYLANKFVKYDEGYPYFKIKNKFELDNKNHKYSLDHNFNLNLRSLAVPYETEKENDEYEEEYAYMNNYVRRFTQDLSSKYTYSNKKDEYNANLDIKHIAALIGGTDEDEPINNQIHKFNIDGLLRATNKFDNGLVLKNTLDLKNKYQYVYSFNEFKNEGYNEHWIIMDPTYGISVSKLFEVDNFKLTPKIGNAFNITLPLTKGIFNKEYLKYKDSIILDLSAEYNKDKLNASLNVNNTFDLRFNKDTLKGIDEKFKLSSTANYEEGILKTSNKASLGLDLKTINDTKERIYPRNLNLDLLLESNNKLILPENLTLDLNLKNKTLVKYDYVLDGGNVPVDFSEEVREVPKFIQNDFIQYNLSKDYKIQKTLVLSINELSLDSKLSHKFIKDKLTVDSNLDLNTKLDTIYLTKEKITKDLTSEDKSKVKPEANKYILGGKIDVKPNVKLSYDFTEKMKLEGNLGLLFNFEKNVINKIDENKKRDEKDTYGFIDENFGIKKIVPEIGLKFEYKW